MTLNEKIRTEHDKCRNSEVRIQKSSIYDCGRVLEYVSPQREREISLGDIAMLEKGMGTQRCQSFGGFSIRDKRLREEAAKESIIQSAKNAGEFFPASELPSLGEKVSDRTGESDVYIDIEYGLAYKAKDPFQKLYLKKHDAFDVIYEHIVHNLLFPSTRYKYVGVSERNGEPAIILAQKIWICDDVVKDEDIETYMKRNGLKKNGYTFEDDYISITDLCGNNVLKGYNELLFIDPIISFKRPAMEVIDYLVKKESDVENIRM